MRFPVLRRPLLLLPALLAALALPVAPALAGEDDGTPPPAPVPAPAPSPAPVPVVGAAKLHVSLGCVSHTRAKAVVTGTNIDTVAFYVDGKRQKTVSSPTSSGRYVFTMSCSRLSVGAHTARAVATFQAGTSPEQQTLRFQITRARQASARFTG
jgi:hypothetical protein